MKDTIDLSKWALYLINKIFNGITEIFQLYKLIKAKKCPIVISNDLIAGIISKDVEHEFIAFCLETIKPHSVLVPAT